METHPSFRSVALKFRAWTHPPDGPDDDETRERIQMRVPSGFQSACFSQQHAMDPHRMRISILPCSDVKSRTRIPDNRTVGLERS